jgi:CheY-like chemotaxis protein
MPEMDGWTFLDTIAHSLSSSPAIDIFMLTSSIDPLDVELAKQRTLVKGFLEKPLTTEKLKHTKFFSFVSDDHQP